MHRTLAELQTKLHQSVDGLDATETQAHPPGRWSIQQIVQHLTLTYDATASVLRERLSKGRPTQTRPKFVQHCIRWTVVELGYFPRGRKAPDMVKPPADAIALPGHQLVTEATRRLETMDDLVDETVRLFGAKRRSVSHIILGPLTPAQWRRFHLVHGLHHLRQIDAIRRQHPSIRPGR